MMKVYHICECCQQIFNNTEVEGPEGAIGLQGICDDCANELGMYDNTTMTTQHFYN